MENNFQILLLRQETVTKKVLHKAAEESGEFIRKKIADKNVKPDKNSKSFEEIITSKKRQEILNQLRQA